MTSRVQRAQPYSQPLVGVMGNVRFIQPTMRAARTRHHLSIAWAAAADGAMEISLTRLSRARPDRSRYAG
jgi:hypothetical protein